MSRSIPNGSTGRINWGNTTALKLLTDMSFGFLIWIGPNRPTSGQPTVLARGQSGPGTEAANFCFLIRIQTDNPFTWNVRYQHQYSNGQSTNSSNIFSTASPYQTWVYVGMSRNDATKTVYMYTGIPGNISLFGSYTYTTSPTGSTSTSCETTAFDVNSGTLQIDDTQMAEVSIWDSVLPIGAHAMMSLGLARKVGSPVLYAPLWGLDSPEPDYSGNQITGAIVGTCIGAPHGPTVPWAAATVVIPSQNTPPSTGVAMRRTLSRLGTRAGSRQILGGY